MSKFESMSGRSIQKPNVTITDADVDEVLVTLRKQRMQWKAVKRPARLGDRVTITYTLTCRDQIIEAHKASPCFVVLGSESFHKSLEHRDLIGARAGKKITAKTLLPHDYPDPELAGQHVVFNIFVVEVCKSVLPALNRQFALELGLSTGSTKAMCKEVRGIMQRKVDSMIKQFVRKQVIDILLSEYLVVVDEEEIQHEVNKRAQAPVTADHRVHPGTESLELTVEHLRALSKLNAIMKDIIRTDNLVLDTKRLQTTITALALRADNPEVAEKGYYNNFEELSRIEAEIMEDQIIEHVLGYLNVESIPTTYKEFISQEEAFSSPRDWTTQPVIQLRTDNKCSFCSGPSKCCRYITQKIPAPRSRQDFDHLLWQVSHEKIEIFKDSDGWHLLFDTPCTHLQSDGGCGIYENRPSVCRNYSVKNCEFDGAASEGWKLFFSDHNSLLGYCKKRFRRWSD